MEANGLTLSWQIKTESYTANINTHQMVRVFQNLLDNARKYADKSAPITVTAETELTGQLHIAIAKRIVQLHGGRISASLLGQKLSIHLFLK